MLSELLSSRGYQKYFSTCIYSEAVFLVLCDPSMSGLWATLTGQCIYRYGSGSLTARSQKGCSWLKIRPLDSSHFFNNCNNHENEINKLLLAKQWMCCLTCVQKWLKMKFRIKYIYFSTFVEQFVVFPIIGHLSFCWQASVKRSLILFLLDIT